MIKKLPTSFKLMGHEYKVALESDIYSEEGIYGDCDPTRKLIRVQKPRKFKTVKFKSGDEDGHIPVNITPDDTIETYYHELVHLILDVIGEDKLYNNEKFVTMFSKCLHQIEKTKQYG